MQQAELPMAPEDLPFQVNDLLTESINDYRAALANNLDELEVVDALDRIESDARSLPEDQDAWVFNYYVRGAWRKGDVRA